MTVSWDLYAKDLLKERPQDFAELILQDANEHELLILTVLSWLPT